MRTVYRVERKSDGTGPYMGPPDGADVNPDLHLAHGFTNERYDRTPNVYDDRARGLRSTSLASRISALGLPSSGKGRRFGFASMRQLRAWFDGDWPERLHERGYHVAVYEVPRRRVASGMKQVVFCPDAAKRVSTLELVA